MSTIFSGVTNIWKISLICVGHVIVIISLHVMDSLLDLCQKTYGNVNVPCKNNEISNKAYWNKWTTRYHTLQYGPGHSLWSWAKLVLIMVYYVGNLLLCRQLISITSGWCSHMLVQHVTIHWVINCLPIWYVSTMIYHDRPWIVLIYCLKWRRLEELSLAHIQETKIKDRTIKLLLIVIVRVLKHLCSNSISNSNSNNNGLLKIPE